MPYFRGDDRFAGWLILGGVIGLELGIVALNVLFNQWNARFYDAIQNKNWDSFQRELLIFTLLAAAFIVGAVYQIYLQQWLRIRWRQWMTANYLQRWLEHGVHYRMRVVGDPADNPDQRIAEDLELFALRTIEIGIGLIGAVLTLVSFVVILWSLSGAAAFPLFGSTITIPGYLVWAALIYAVLGTIVTHYIGRPLIALNFNQQRYEADFRYHLVRVRENGEQIALLDGEPAERRRLGERFSHAGRQLPPHHERAEAAHRILRELYPGFDHLPVRGGEPGLFRGHDLARHPHADRLGLRPGAEFA